MTQVLDARCDKSGGYTVDVTRVQRIGRVSSEWFSRPADQRFLSLSDLARSVRDRADRSRTRIVESALIHVEASRNDPERLSLILPGASGLAMLGAGGQIPDQLWALLAAPDLAAGVGAARPDLCRAARSHSSRDGLAAAAPLSVRHAAP